MTSAAPLLNTPSDDPTSWDQWAFQLSQNIGDILAAIRGRGLVIQPQPIYPIPVVDMQMWLERVSGVLGEICQAVGVQSADVENTDLSDPRERQAWTFQIFTEINAARQALRI